MSELWALCDPCGRWFYPEGFSDEVEDQAPTCPVCATEAARVSERPEANA